MSLNIIFAGTPDISTPTLNALIQSEHTVVAVYTQPDRKKGRGQKVLASPVKHLAEQHNIPVEQPIKLTSDDVLTTWQQYQADIVVVIAYGLLLPQAFLTANRLGCINIHVSLLPKWRGAAPIQHAILNGDSHTGISIMQMDVGLDTGPIWSQSTCPILPNDTTTSLSQRLATEGAKQLLNTLPMIIGDQHQPTPQDDTKTSYANKIKKTDACIDWQQPASIIERRIRAFNPWPVAYTQWNGERVRIWQASLCNTPNQSNNPGQLIIDNNQLMVQTGDDLLTIELLQLPGGKTINARDFINAQQQNLTKKTSYFE